MSGDAFGGEEGGGTDHLEEVAGAAAENLADFCERDLLHLGDPAAHLAQIRLQVVGLEEAEEHGEVDVLAAPARVDVAHHCVESGRHLLRCGRLLPHLHRAPHHHAFRFLPAAEKRIELVYDVGFTIFFSTQSLLFYRFLARAGAGRGAGLCRNAATRSLRRGGAVSSCDSQFNVFERVVGLPKKGSVWEGGIERKKGGVERGELLGGR